MNWLLRWLYRRLEAIRAEELQAQRIKSSRALDALVGEMKLLRATELPCLRDLEGVTVTVRADGS